MQPSPSYSASWKQEDSEFNLKEWGVKARIIRENTKPRRYSSSSITSFREDAIRSSFRSNITFSSTASSPGYPFKDEIDPATYSFTTALKGLQARSGYKSWECLSPTDGFALNSKWNDAEKYICNPVSGEVPMECLSSKTLLSGRSFRNSTTTTTTTTNNSITMSAPLVYSSRHIHTKPSSFSYIQEDDAVDLQFHSSENKKEGMTRDAGTQSTLPYIISSCSPSSAITSSSITEDSTNSNAIMKSDLEVQIKDKETWDKTTEAQRAKNECKKKDEQFCRQGGCFSWIRQRRHRENEKQIRNNIFVIHFKVC